VQRVSSDQDLVQAASGLLSGLTHMAGVVTLPRQVVGSLRQIEFLPLSDRRVLAILVINEKEVQNRILDVDRDYGEDELRRAANYLNDHFAGTYMAFLALAAPEDAGAAKHLLDALNAHTAALVEDEPTHQTQAEVLRTEARRLADPDRAFAQFDAQLSQEATGEPLPEARAKLAELLENRRLLLDQVLEADEFYLGQLQELEAAERRLLDVAGAYEAFLDKNLMWLRSAEPSRPGDLADLPGEARSLASPEIWGGLAGVFLERIRRPAWWIALLVAALTHAGVRRESPDGGSVPAWREMVAFSLPLIAVSFGISALLNLDLLLLKHFFPASEIVGYYNGAANLGKAPYWVLSAFATTALPSVAAALGSKDAEGARTLVQRHVSYVLLISLPAVALVLPSARQLLVLVYPEPYGAAAGALALLVGSGSALALLTVLTSAITAAGKPRVSMAIVLACTVLQCFAGIVLVPRYGMLGAATANLTTVLCGVAVAGWVVRARFGGVVETGRLLKAAGLSSLLGLALWLWPDYPPLALPLLYVVGLLLYGGGMVVLGGLAPSELERVRRLLRRPGTRPPAETSTGN